MRTKARTAKTRLRTVPTRIEEEKSFESEFVRERREREFVLRRVGGGVMVFAAV